MWQPSADRRANRCSAQKEFSKLWALLPVEVQMPVQVSGSMNGAACMCVCVNACTKGTCRHVLRCGTCCSLCQLMSHSKQGACVFTCYYALLCCAGMPKCCKLCSLCAACCCMCYVCCVLCVHQQALFTVDLPPGGKLPAGHRPVCTQTFIAGMKDEVIIMSSLMKPKKITFIGRCVWLGG